MFVCILKHVGVRGRITLVISPHVYLIWMWRNARIPGLVFYEFLRVLFSLFPLLPWETWDCRFSIQCQISHRVRNLNWCIFSYLCSKHFTYWPISTTLKYNFTYLYFKTQQICLLFSPCSDRIKNFLGCFGLWSSAEFEKGVLGVCCINIDLRHITRTLL